MRQGFLEKVLKSVIYIKSFIVFTLIVSISLASATPAAADKDSRYAAIVLDANTGKTLYSSSADSRRYPASLTKMMTLYLTFEALSKGRIRKNSKVVFSKNAATKPPTKIGVKAGGSISVEAIILSLITRSANDSSTALGEMIAGSEANFARMMTAKARSLGMKSTVFRNASGLPDTAQFTTARDMAKLGIALREHFPQYYSYFSTRSFAFGRQRIANHNRLLGRLKGVDGIKTGYTRASGFNLVSSVQDGNRRIVAVILGGTSGASRDTQMAQLINTYMPQASRRGGGNLIARTNTPMPKTTVANALLPKRNAPTPETRPKAEVIEVADASADDTMKADADLLAAAVFAPKPIIARATQPKIAMASTERFSGKIPFQIRKSKDRTPSEPDAVEEAYAEQSTPAVQALNHLKNPSVLSRWSIQIASSTSDSEAYSILDKTAKQAPMVLIDASGFTVPFEKGGVTYFRSRFAGFNSKDSAWNACNALKKKKIACYAIAQ